MIFAQTQEAMYSWSLSAAVKFMFDHWAQAADRYIFGLSGSYIGSICLLTNYAVAATDAAKQLAF